MTIELLKSKIHGAKVTMADLNYTGSISVDQNYLEGSGLRANEKVLVVNNHNGARFETYIIKGERGSKTICVNGAAARMVAVGDILIIIGFASMTPEEADNHVPKVIFPQEDGSYKTIENIVDSEIYKIYDTALTLSSSTIHQCLINISIKYGRSQEEIIEKYNKIRNL